MKKYVVVLESEWNSGVDPVTCLASYDSKGEAKTAHLVVKEGEGVPCPRDALTPTDNKITITVIDSYGKEREETALICILLLAEVVHQETSG